jgi:uncharacterized protein GlcG (DUF336 family)
MSKITLEQALAAIGACVKKAEAINTNSIIAIVDQGGHIIAEARMDKAIRASIPIAFHKATTSALSGLPTDSLAEACRPGGPLYGMQEASCGKLVIFGGGFPVIRNGETIGAIGVSGGTNELDMEVARAGLVILEEEHFWVRPPWPHFQS